MEDKYGAATSLRSCCVVLGDQDGWGTNRLSKAESILGTGMSQNLSRGRRHAWLSASGVEKSRESLCQYPVNSGRHGKSFSSGHLRGVFWGASCHGEMPIANCPQVWGTNPLSALQPYPGIVGFVIWNLSTIHWSYVKLMTCSMLNSRS